MAQSVEFTCGLLDPLLENQISIYQSPEGQPAPDHHDHQSATFTDVVVPPETEAGDETVAGSASLVTPTRTPRADSVRTA